MADLLRDLQDCRLLLRLLTEKLAYIERHLYPPNPDVMPGQSHAFHHAADDGQSGATTFLHPSDAGMSESTSFLDKSGTGISWNAAFHSHDDDGMSGNHAFQRTEEQVSRLAHLLKGGEMKKLSRAQVLHAAKFMGRIYDGGEVRNPHSTLAALTGMSVSGIGKLVMSLRRRSLIETVGFQRYRLTDKAKGYLQQAFMA